MKTSVPTHSSSRLCASASISSLSKGQRWSRLPETGGKGQAGAQPRGRWGPGHLSTRGKGWLCALGRGAGVATGAAWLWGWGVSPLGPRHVGVRQTQGGAGPGQSGRHGRFGEGDSWKPRLPCPTSLAHSGLPFALSPRAQSHPCPWGGAPSPAVSLVWTPGHSRELAGSLRAVASRIN